MRCKIGIIIVATLLFVSAIGCSNPTTTAVSQPIEPPINDAAILFMGILVIEIIVLLAVIWAAWRRGRR
jgi:heme/copper-type cytochrome/quinol oxidase subunit 2